MGQGVTLPRFLAKAILHLPTKAIQLFAKRRQQAVQALAILLIHPPVAVLKNAICQILKLFAKTLLAVHHLANFVFRMQLSGFKAGGHFAKIGFQRGVDIAQAAQFVIEQFTLFSPV